MRKIRWVVVIVMSCFVMWSEAWGEESEGIVLGPGIRAGVLLEVEASVGKEGGEDISDVALATFELGIDAELNELVSGHVLLLWEEGDTEPIDLDEGTITIGGSEDMPFSITAGKLYVPFGRFNSHFVSDPITLELAETRESAVILGYAQGMIEIQIGAFNGDLNEEGDDDDVDDIVASVILSPIESLSFGVSWISDIGEAGGMEEGLAEAVEGAEPDTPGIAYEEKQVVLAALCA